MKILPTSRRVVVRTALLGAILVAFSACSRAPLINVVKDFDVAASSAIPAVQQYFMQINEVERVARIDELVAKKERIDLKKLDASQLISPEDLQARLTALTAMLKYGNLLAKLASTDVVESVTGSIDELNSSVVTLKTDLTKLSNPSAPANQKFSAASGAFAGIANVIAERALNKKIDAALIKAIKDADVPVKNLIAVLKDDLRNAVIARRDAVSKARVNATDSYNAEIKNMPPDVDRLIALGNEIKRSERQWELFNAVNPSDLLDGLAASHTALVKAANNPKDASSLAAVVSAIDSFTTTVKAFAAVVSALRTL